MTAIEVVNAELSKLRLQIDDARRAFRYQEAESLTILAAGIKMGALMALTATGLPRAPPLA